MDPKKQVEEIAKSDLSKVLSQGFAQIYRTKPEFPITYLAKWLKEYNNAQQRKNVIVSTKKDRTQKLDSMYKKRQQQQKLLNDQRQAKLKQQQKRDEQFSQALQKNKHLGDLLEQWLPQYIQNSFKFSGSYVGKLDYKKKSIQQHNFEPGSQNDTQNPKIISYIGSSKSHSILIKDKFLPNQLGISYEVFQDQPEQNAEQGQQEVAAVQKKTYIYVPNVLKEPKLYYFKYPKLGSYVCYPLKIKSFLSIPTFQKGIIDYKQYLSNKEAAQNEYKEKLTEAKSESEDAAKKVQDFQVVEQDPANEEQKKALEAEYQVCEQKVKELEANPPIIQEVVFQVIQLNFFLGCDTLGQDRQINQNELSCINGIAERLISEWNKKEKAMLLADILAYLDDSNNFQAVQNQFQEHERNIASTYESQTKQQFQNKEKEGEFEYSLLKCEKLCSLFTEPAFKASMDTYINYNIPKYTQLVQIWCMLLGYKKECINMPGANTLNHRKLITKQSFEKLIEQLNKYELRRESSQDCQPEFKINKLLERLQKIDQQALAKYNSFLLALSNILKCYCWTRIYCRDARTQTHEAKVKAKEERQAQIIKWDEDIEKALETTKAELTEQEQPTFVQEQWRKTHQSENPKPLPLQVQDFKPHLDIE